MKEGLRARGQVNRGLTCRLSLLLCLKYHRRIQFVSPVQMENLLVPHTLWKLNPALNSTLTFSSTCVTEPDRCLSPSPDIDWCPPLLCCHCKQTYTACVRLKANTKRSKHTESLQTRCGKRLESRELWRSGGVSDVWIRGCAALISLCSLWSGKHYWTFALDTHYYFKGAVRQVIGTSLRTSTQSSPSRRFGGGYHPPC